MFQEEPCPSWNPQIFDYWSYPQQVYWQLEGPDGISLTLC